MQNFNSDIFNLPGLQWPPIEDDRFCKSIGNLSPTVNPLELHLPNPLHSEITASPSSQSTNTLSPALTEEEAAHVDNLLFHGVNSPVLPPDLRTSSAAVAETPPDLAPAPHVDDLAFLGGDGPVLTPDFFTSFVAVAETPPGLPPAPSQLSSTQTISHESSAPASPALFSPTTAYAAPSVSPPAHKRQYSLLEDPYPSQDPPTPGPSAPRPAKRPCTSFPGESVFQLDRTVAPIKPSQPAGPPMGKPRAPRNDYSLCRCSDGLTSKPARHWRACPYNPNRAGVRRFECETCGKLFTREDNMKRHIEDFH